MAALFAVLGAAQLFAAPVNDQFADRIAVVGPNVSLTSSNIGATKEAGEPNHASAYAGYTASGKSVWYSWTPEVGGYVEITLAGSFNKVIAIYTGSSVANLSPVVAGLNNNPYDATCEFVGAAGTEYLIAVDGYGTSAGTFTLTLAATPPPPNDNFANRAVLTGTDTTVTGSNVSASKEPGEPNHAGLAGGQSVWWTWTAPASGWVTVKSSGNLSMLLGVYTGDSVTALTEVASGRVISWQIPAVAGFNATAGTTYQIAVDGATFSYPFDSFELNVVLQAPPANDNFAASTVLTGTDVEIWGVSNLSATKEPGEPNHAANPGGRSVWWVWTAPASGRFTVFTDVRSLAPLDRLLAVYTGASVSALTEVVSTSGSSNIVAKVNFDAVQGTVYHIAADGMDGASGSFHLFLRMPPPNDDFADRIAITNLGQNIAGTTLGATGEPGEPDHGSDPAEASVWWKWTAPSSGRIVVSATASRSSLVLDVYTGDVLTTLSTVASGYSSSSSPAYATFDAVAGTEYQIAANTSASGTALSLLIQYVTTPANDAFADRLTVTNTTGASFYVTGSNLGATKEPGEIWQGTASVWWSWTAPTDGEVLIELETYGTTMTYPWLALFSGTTISNLTTIYPRVEFAGQQRYHDVRFTVVAGTTYSIWVASRGGVEGTYTLRGTFEPPPVNDDFSNRITITNTPFLYQWGYLYVNGGYNVSATKETGEPWHGGATYNVGGRSVWWTWTAPYSGRISVSVEPIRFTFSSMIGLYTGSGVSNLTRIANVYSTCTSGASGLNAPVTAGTTYQIAVDGGGPYGNSGEFQLALHVYFDNDAPVVSITQPLPGPLDETTVTVSGTATDPLGTGGFQYASGVTLVEVRLNGGTWQSATGTTAWSLELTLTNGPNLIEARATDALGHASNLASVAVDSVAPSPFATWIEAYFPTNTDPTVIGPEADPDRDGQSNLVEFALGGSPSDPLNNARIFSRMADSDDPDPDDELLLTIAVRAGTPIFVGSPSPSATVDGISYHVQGSRDLAAFVTLVQVVAPVSVGLAPAPTGYEYRTFSLSHSIHPGGFLRVRVANLN